MNIIIYSMMCQCQKIDESGHPHFAKFLLMAGGLVGWALLVIGTGAAVAGFMGVGMAASLGLLLAALKAGIPPDLAGGVAIMAVATWAGWPVLSRARRRG